MNKESRIELQRIDCNCNDCKFMVRDIDTFNKWKEFHRNLSKKDFDKKKELGLIREKAPFQFRQNGLINYGDCSKLNKKVTFLPNQCCPENQECFKHRRDDIISST